ncbi:MAG TPA: hypothetical protein QGF58_10280 [Myxococcota bacterium]|nr:hypothetical protein [Myxococcota bacterium]
MGALSDALNDPGKRKAIIDDGIAVIEEEVASKRGFRGLAVKAGFKAVKAIRPGVIGMALDHLMPDFAKQIDPFYDDWKASGSGTLESYFSSRDGEIANALLSITDGRARHAQNRAMKKAYDKLRPQGVEHTKAAIPRLAGLVGRHV